MYNVFGRSFSRTYQWTVDSTVNFDFHFALRKCISIFSTKSRIEANQSLNWYKSLEEYYFRPEWELYDLKIDDHEEFNVASKESYKVYNLLVINKFFVISCNGSCD